MKEFDFIEWIRSQSRFDPAAVPIGPGDDMAVVDCDGRRLLVATDQVLDGTHFILHQHGPEAAGRKAMARNLSDVAAMAAAPVAAVATAALPKGFTESDARKLYRGMRVMGDQFGCPLIGGDVGCWDGKLALSVAILARPDGIEPLLRSGAKAGDAVCVTGRLGGAWRSGRHMTFTPRIRQARTLAGKYTLHAMIDISDGLASDLWHICKASLVAAEIEAAAIPIHPDAMTTPQDQFKSVSLPAPLAAALGEGEDYELLFALPQDQANRLLSDQPLDVPVTRIGTIVAGSDITLISADGRRQPMPDIGWEHGK